MNNLFTKIHLPFIAVFFISTVSFGQYGNEWINQGQTYYKIKVGSNGIYKLTYTTLLDAGLPITSINPKNIHNNLIYFFNFFFWYFSYKGTNFKFTR